MSKSLLSKILGNAEPDDDDDKPVVGGKMINLDNLKVGDRIIIEQTVVVTDKQYALDKRLGSIGGAKTVYLEVKGVDGVFRNVVAVASGPEKAKVKLDTSVKREPNNPKPAITPVEDNDRDEDEMNGSFSPYPFRS